MARVTVHCGVALLVAATCRGADQVLFDCAAAVRSVANTRKVALCDTHRQVKALGCDGLAAVLADPAHPSARGHEQIAAAIADLLVP